MGRGESYVRDFETPSRPNNRKAGARARVEIGDMPVLDLTTQTNAGFGTLYNTLIFYFHE